jgi:PAS domain S-box-containing protein
MKILIVDDNPDDRRFLRTSLTHHDCEVIEASDGREGFAMAEAQRPQLIISDALMPQMDGFQFLRAVKGDEQLKSIPFIFYSAVYTGHKEEELAKSLGAEAFIIKPKDPDELWEEIVQVIENSKLRGGRSSASELIKEEEDFLRKYSHIVATKLEEKVRDLNAVCKELRQSEEDAKLLGHQWQSTFDSVKEAIWITDMNGKIVQCNKSAFGFLDIPVQEAVGKDCWELMHGTKEPIDGCPCTRMKISGKRETLEVKAGNKYLDVTVDPILDANGNIVCAVHTMTDITDKIRSADERKKLEAQLLQSQKMEAVGQLAGGIAHDFNNCLSTIIGFAELAKLRLKDDEPLRENIDHIIGGAEKAANLTRSLLAFSRIQVMDMKPVNLNEIIGRVIKFVARIIGEDVRLKAELSEQDLYIMADTGQIEQVLLNLSTNARDAMPEGGSLVLRTERIDLEDDFIKKYGYGKVGEFAILSVADTGTGMAEAVKEKIFEPFFTTKEIGKGTGLGLSMAYGIIRQHNGFINVYSEPDQGTEFKIYLPLTQHAAHLEKKIPVSYPVGGTETILVAEDNDSLRRLAITVFESFGYKVIEAKDGDDAVKKFAANKESIDLCLFDVIMPKKNGKEAFEIIKEMKSDIKVIFLSGYNVDMINRKGIFEEHMDFVLKPANPKDLLRKVREVLDRCG